MPKSNNQKLKMLYLLKLLWEKSDENHPISMAQILKYLEDNGINAERKSIYNDVESLNDMGFDVNLQKGHDGGYFIGARDFELPELKILVDSVQASRFLSDKKTRSLIEKLSRLCSEDQAKQLKRQNLLSNAGRFADENIFYLVDSIHRAINENKIISFKYFHIDENKEKFYHHKNKPIKTNPVALVWDDENYYLVAWDSVHEAVINYRVDRMENVQVTDESRRQQDRINKIDLTDYTSVNFSMYNGTRVTVQIVFEKELTGVMLERFGRDIIFYPCDDGKICIHPTVAVSPTFFGWLFGLNGKAYLKGPDSVVEELKTHFENFSKAQFK